MIELYTWSRGILGYVKYTSTKCLGFFLKKYNNVVGEVLIGIFSYSSWFPLDPPNITTWEKKVCISSYDFQGEGGKQKSDSSLLSWKGPFQTENTPKEKKWLERGSPQGTKSLLSKKSCWRGKRVKRSEGHTSSRVTDCETSRVLNRKALHPGNPSLSSKSEGWPPYS